jgi:hypothetical protein
MSEHEFDFYLSVLGSLLRLSPQQRAQIADELRDHLEEQLEELTRLGCSRQEAIARALSEFGDAAGLAAHFTQIANQKKRRLIMRCTLGTVAAAVALFVGTTLFWPEEHNPGPARAVAQAPAKPSAQAPAQVQPGGDGRPAADPSIAEVEPKLSARLQKLEFINSPFSEVIAYLSDAIGVDILVDRAYFDQLGASQDTPINLTIKHTAVSARTALELAIEQVGGGSLGYTIRDGVIYLTEKYQVNEIQVYNCRDLLRHTAGPGPAGAGSPDGGIGAPGGAGEGGFASGGLGVVGPGGFAGGPGGGLGAGAMGPGGLGGGYGGFGVDQQHSALVNVIISTIHPNSWAEAGGEGSVTEFNGLLIVKHSQTVHREIKQLLTMMREAAASGPER